MSHTVVEIPAYTLCRLAPPHSAFPSARIRRTSARKLVVAAFAYLPKAIDLRIIRQVNL